MKKKYLFIGDLESINLEIICKSHKFLKKKIYYIIVCNIKEVKTSLKKLTFKIKLKEVLDPFNFSSIDEDSLNLFNVENISKKKYINLLNQLTVSNYLSNITKFDLITMPINKSIFKKKIAFNGITEYLGKLNNKKTKMLMYGENFSVLPITTHINPKKIHLKIKSTILKKEIIEILNNIKIYKKFLKIKKIKFLCYNPHCGEDSTMGLEDQIIKKVIGNFKLIEGPYPADSAFIKYYKNSLYISTYHDQGLIPFKILNSRGINLTLGLDYLRMSPAHGTAEDIKYKNKSNNTSYLECMIF